MSGRGRGGSQAQAEEVVFRGQRLGKGELGWMAAIIRRRPQWTREEIARAVCRHFEWKQGNGQLAVRACKNLLERLERAGRWQLPARRRVGNFRKKSQPAGQCDAPPQRRPITERCGTLALRLIESEERARWQEQLAAFHYLGQAAVVGETLWYVASLDAEPVAVLVWGVGALRNAPRDHYLGWDVATRLARLPEVVNNSRFLMLPWVRVPNLASEILARNLRRISADWEQVYGHRVRLAETFVDAHRFRGTCYRAANWRCVGQTTGRSRQDRDKCLRVPVKDIYLCALAGGRR